MIDKDLERAVIDRYGNIGNIELGEEINERYRSIGLNKNGESSLRPQIYFPEAPQQREYCYSTNGTQNMEIKGLPKSWR